MQIKEPHLQTLALKRQVRRIDSNYVAFIDKSLSFAKVPADLFNGYCRATQQPTTRTFSLELIIIESSHETFFQGPRSHRINQIGSEERSLWTSVSLAP